MVIYMCTTTIACLSTARAVPLRAVWYKFLPWHVRTFCTYPEYRTHSSTSWSTYHCPYPCALCCQLAEHDGALWLRRAGGAHEPQFEVQTPGKRTHEVSHHVFQGVLVGRRTVDHCHWGSYNSIRPSRKLQGRVGSRNVTGCRRTKSQG